MPRIICISDTHNMHNQVELPSPLEGDILIHAGDATVSGTVAEVEDFLRWMETRPYTTKILVAGNHDFLFDADPILSSRLLKELAPSVTYLEDSGVVLENGLSVWGSPWVGGLKHWAFGNLNPLSKAWEKIPYSTDILVTHSPAFGELDYLPGAGSLGSKSLNGRIHELNLKLHVHGHIHFSYGVRSYPTGPRPIRVNAALACEVTFTHKYYLSNPPVVIDL